MTDQQTSYLQAISATYPDLAIEQVRCNRQGQFNDILIINEESIFRFPKTSREATKHGTEIALLRNLQQHLLLPIPNPCYQSREGAPLGQIFWGYSMLSGEPLWPGTLRDLRDEMLQQRLAEQLAHFLAQLHSIRELEIELPAFQGNQEWIDLYQRFREKLYPFMRPDARRDMTRHFEDFLHDERNQSYQPALIHSDFGPSNILYDAHSQQISGIIDFSSAGWGDPALDFAAVICEVSYGEDFLARFSSIYPGIESVLTRSRFYAGTFALQEALFGLEDNDPAAFESGIARYR